jgi:hypothetical protein
MENETIILTGADQIQAFRMFSVHARMKLEMTGLKFRVNTTAAIRRELGLPKNTRRIDVLRAFEAKMTEQGLQFTPYQEKS